MLGLCWAPLLGVEKGNGRPRSTKSRVKREGVPGPELGDEQTLHEAVGEMLQSNEAHSGRNTPLSARPRPAELCLLSGRPSRALTLG